MDLESENSSKNGPLWRTSSLAGASYLFAQKVSSSSHFSVKSGKKNAESDQRGLSGMPNTTEPSLPRSERLHRLLPSRGEAASSSSAQVREAALLGKAGILISLGFHSPPRSHWAVRWLSLVFGMHLFETSVLVSESHINIRTLTLSTTLWHWAGCWPALG